MPSQVQSYLTTKSATVTTVASSAGGTKLTGTDTRDGTTASLLIINNSAVAVTIFGDNTLTTTKGIVLAANGGQYLDNNSTDVWYGIAASATAAVTCIFFKTNYGGVQTAGIVG